MSVSTFQEFYNAFQSAVESSEDRIIELDSSFNLEEPLPAINHGYQLLITTSDGERKTIGSSDSMADDFQHFTLLKGKLKLLGIHLTADVTDVEKQAPGGITVGNSGSLFIENCVIDNCQHSIAGAIWTLRNGRVELSDTLIKNCSGGLTGAIMIDEGAFLKMDYNSKIIDCFCANGNYESQVAIYGTFLLNHGEITFSSPSLYNCVHILEEGRLEMNGGTISKGLVGISLGAGSTMVLNGGIIEANNLGLLTIIDGAKKIIQVLEGEIRNNRIGIGINEGAFITMTGGKIHGHFQENGAGILAVYGKTGSLTMTGGEIFNNQQGICIQQTSLTFLIKGDAKIYENAYGILIDNASMTLEGGHVFNNRMPPNRYAYGGIGIFAGYHSKLELIGGTIYGNEIFGVWGQYQSTIQMKGTQVYNNGIDGIHLDYCDMEMEGGEIYENGHCGITLDQEAFDEPVGSRLVIIDGVIRKNKADGIRTMGISLVEMDGGEIFGNDEAGIKCLHQTTTSVINGRIFGNYFGVEIQGTPASLNEASFQMKGGKIFENTIGVFCRSRGNFTMDNGEITKNFGTVEDIPDGSGGIGILIHNGTVVMNGGRISCHIGFPNTPALVYSLRLGASTPQRLGAGICILERGSFMMRAGEIVNNEAPAGAAIFAPNQIYTPLTIQSTAHFNCNKARDEAPFQYNGGIRHVDSAIFFSHTSVGCHLLNNYDINYSGGTPITTRFLDFFPDPAFARVVYEQLDREIDAFVTPCEFTPIKTLDGSSRHIHSIQGAQYLTQLEKIILNDNHILDLSPLGYFDSLIFEAYRQWCRLPDIYVSKPQDFSIYGPFIEIFIEDPEVSEAPIEIKENISVSVFKYNGVYKNERITWWEQGYNTVKWQEGQFDGYGFQRSVPIPINLLFPHPGVAGHVAKILHKNSSDPIDITQLLRIKYLDLSNVGVETDRDLEGMQYLFGLQSLHLAEGTVPSARNFFESHGMDIFIY